jgi:hypothetical protein
MLQPRLKRIRQVDLLDLPPEIASEPKWLGSWLN